MQPTATPTEYLSISEAALLLGVSRATIQRRIASGELPATRLGARGNAVRIPRAALDAWLWSSDDRSAA
jgi:excisionase family DNA binding protein